MSPDVPLERDLLLVDPSALTPGLSGLIGPRGHELTLVDPGVDAELVLLPDRILGRLDAPVRIDPVALGLVDGDTFELAARLVGTTQLGPTLPFEVDLAPPELLSHAPVGPVTTLTSVSLRFGDRSGLDPSTSLAFALDETPVFPLDMTRSEADTELTVTLPPLPDGTLRIEVRPIDPLGNAAAPSIVAINIDTAPPALAVTTRPETVVTSELTVSLDAPDATSATVTLTDPLGTTRDATLAPPLTHTFPDSDLIGLAEGPLTLVVTASDALGNTATTATTLVLDTTPPLVVDFSPAPGTSLRPPFVLMVRAFDAGAGLVSLEAEGQSAPFSDDGLAQLTLDTVPTSFVLRDGADRTTTVRPGLRLDLAPPTTAFTPDPTPPDDGAPRPLLTDLTLSLADTGCLPNTVATAATLTVTRENAPTPFATSLTATTIAITLEAPGSGAWSVSATPTDRCGNTGAPAVAFYFVDAEPPDLDIAATLARPPFAPAMLPVTATAYDQNGLAGLTFQATSTSSTSSTSSSSAAPAAPAAPTQTPSTQVTPVTPATEPFTLLDLGALPDGPFTVVAIATDRATNTTTATLDLILDRQPPSVVASLPAWVSPTFVLPVTASDTLAGLESLDIHRGPTHLLSVPLDGTDVDLALDLALSPTLGPATLTLAVTDRAGNPTTTTLTTTVDPTPPHVAAAPADAVVEALPPLTFILADADSGPAPLTSLIAVTHDGDSLPDIAFATTSDSLTLLPTAAPGRWRFTVTPRDLAGQLGPPHTTAIDVDHTPPTIALSGATGWSSGDSAPIQLDVADDTAVAKVDLVLRDVSDQVVTATITGPPWATSLPLATLDDGELTLLAIATDLAGREASVTDVLRVDNLPPDLTATAPVARVGAHFELPFVAFDDGAGLDRIDVFDGDTLVGARLLNGLPSASSTVAVTLTASGLIDLTLVAIDRVGRETTLPLTLSVDADAPTLRSAPTDTTITTAPIALVFDDLDVGVDPVATAATLVATVDDTPITASTSTSNMADGSATLTLALPTNLQGTLRISLHATDLLGNARPITLDYRVDNRRPRLASSSPVDDATAVSPMTSVTLTFNEPIVAAPDAITLSGISLPNRSIPFTRTATPTTLTLTPQTPLRSNETVLVTFAADALTDLAGNPLEPTDPLTFRAETFAFIDLATSLGLVTYRGGTGESGENHGPGGVFADLDNDGFPELILPPAPGVPLVVHLNRPASNPSARPARALVPLELSPGREAGAAGLLAADIDNDGDTDLYAVFWNAPNVLFRNLLADTGALAFEDATDTTVPVGDDPDQLGLALSRHEGQRLELSMTAAFADVNRDGLLDLYVGNHNGHWNAPQVGSRTGQRDTLYVQNADHTFTDVTMAANCPGWLSPQGRYVEPYQSFSSSNAVIFADLDDDSWPDLIVTNKTRHPSDRDMLYRNLGPDEDGLWQGFAPINSDFEPPWGATNPLAMGIDAADVDGDGDLDFYITDWAAQGVVPGPNELWLNQLAETGTFSLVKSAEATGVYSWGAQFQDFDNDARLDLHIATNANEWDRLYMRRPNTNMAWVFTDEAQLANIRQRQNSRGSMTADLDRDGFVDLVVINLDAPPRVYWNRYAPSANRWLSVRLVGDPNLPGPYRSSRDAIGAKLIVRADVRDDGTLTQQTRHVMSGSSNATSTSSLDLELGLGAALTATLEVRWPSGRISHFADVPTNQHLTLYETLAPPPR